MVNNKVEIKSFMGSDVRIVNGTHMVLKDLFSALGRVKDNGDWSDEKNKLVSFLDLIGKREDSETFVVLVKQGKIKTSQNVECLNLNTVPIILTQFKPTARKGEEALIKWVEFMKFVDGLLSSLEIHKFIVTDKEFQKDKMSILVDEGGSPTNTNNQVAIVMAKLIGVYDVGIKRLFKEDLRKYQSQTTVDLLEVRQFVLDNFVNAYRFTLSHKDAREMTERLASRKYDLAI